MHHQAVKVISWNILREGAGLHDWRQRGRGLATVLEREAPALVCLQEARPAQMAELERALPRHDHLSAGRDDGLRQGEHCPVFYERERFRPIEGGTFWLSETPEVPSRTWRDRHRRICTWLRLEDLAAGNRLIVFNTHFPVLHHPLSRRRSAELVASRIRELRQGDPVILTGDFNSTPRSAPWKVFGREELTDSEVSASGRRRLTPTWHLRGLPLIRLDAIFLSPGWEVREHRVLADRPHAIFPSDHFGVAATLRYSCTA